MKKTFLSPQEGTWPRSSGLMNVEVAFSLHNCCPSAYILVCGSHLIGQYPLAGSPESSRNSFTPDQKKAMLAMRT